MKDLLEKLSSYNIFNYLLPGVLFAAIGTRTTSYSLIQSDIVTGVFLYYFFGLVICRGGSLFVEPLLKKLGVLNFADYKQFVAASKADPKIELFSEQNNMYRTFISLVLCLFILKGIAFLEAQIPWLTILRNSGGLFLLLGIFILSYRKQTGYIRKRIESSQKEELKDG